MTPCCCMSHQTGTKIAAIVCILFYGLVIVGVVSEFRGESGSGDLQPETDKSRTFNLTAIGIFIFLMVVSALLLVGANKRNRKMCLTWFYSSIVLLVFTFFSTLKSLFSVTTPINYFGIIWLLVQAYFLWVVWIFVEELKHEAAVSPSRNTKSAV